MADDLVTLLRRGAANIAILYLRSSQEGYMNVPDEYINYAAAAGVGVQRPYPLPVPDPIQYLSQGNPRGAQMQNMIQQFIVQCARCHRLVYTRAGTWSLTAEPSIANQGQDWLNYSATLPMPGTQQQFYGFVPGWAVDQSQLTPTAVGYGIFATGQNASRSQVVALLTNLSTRIINYMQNNPIGMSYCHTNCHNNCHSSRGRR